MPEMREHLTRLRCETPTHSYLADGVYCGYDGYQIWLVVERFGVTHEIALDETTLAALYRYATGHIKEPTE